MAKMNSSKNFETASSLLLAWYVWEMVSGVKRKTWGQLKNCLSTRLSDRLHCVSALCSNSDPRNIIYIPVVKFFAYLELESKSRFLEAPLRLETLVFEPVKIQARGRGFDFTPEGCSLPQLEWWNDGKMEYWDQKRNVSWFIIPDKLPILKINLIPPNSLFQCSIIPALPGPIYRQSLISLTWPRGLGFPCWNKHTDFCWRLSSVKGRVCHDYW